MLEHSRQCATTPPGRDFVTSIAIEFAIRSSHDRQTYHTTGTKEGDRYTFVDPDGNRHTLTESDGVLTYHRTGEAELEFRFDPKRDTTGTYHVLGHTMTFTIRTLHAKHHNDTIHVVYALYQGGEAIGETDLILRYHPIKEE